MYMGHAFLKKEFCVRPKIGWTIDAFGHSAANAALFADFGFEATFFSRLDEKERDERKNNKGMTFLWRPLSDNFGSQK
jgi:lysosomal alpha-mannosidase